jgi:elongation factor Ts
VRRVAQVTGERVTAYLHRTSKDLPPQIGVLLATSGGDEEIAHDVAMHVAAFSPTVLSREDVPADVVANEQRLAEATAREEGKPEAACPRSSRAGSTATSRRTSCSTRPSPRTRRSRSRRCSRRPAREATAFARFRVGN